MNRTTRTRIAERKALLSARAQMERMQFAMALHSLRETVLPKRAAHGRSAKPGRIAATVVAVGLPLLGRRRLAGALRAVSLALTGWRIVRNWQRHR